MARKSKKKKLIEYNVKVPMHDFPAYVLDELIKFGLYGSTREEVVEYIIHDWLSNRWKILSDLEITIEKARDAGYLQKRR